MHYITDLLGAIYLTVVIGLAIYGLNSIITAILFLFTKKRMASEIEWPEPEKWPLVTIQLPVFNEKYTLERLLRAVTALDYPRELLQIQVLDDSTDDTSLLSARLVEGHSSLGADIPWLHPTDPKG